VKSPFVTSFLNVVLVITFYQTGPDGLFYFSKVFNLILQSANIKFNNISYKYSKNDKPLFQNLNLDFQLNNKYILVGDSAAGKSTILNLVAGLLRNNSGDIKMNDISYSAISDNDLHEKISYLQQDPYIFSASLKWNLTLGKNIPDAKINNAIHECGLEDMIAKLSNGVDTVLSDQGKQLSGGQKQRISFAREILRDKPIYLLDEATSALDKSASVKLEKAILSKKNTTVIMVTHHLREEIKQLANEVINLNEVKE
uniref:ATP-binding cassette domain-containing protein n=3 Tax=Lactobacillus TaxID=1578 RepID=UPI0020CF3D31